MPLKTFNLFLAAYFSDSNKLLPLLTSDKLCTIIIPNDIDKYLGTDNISVSVADILQMNKDCWYSIKDNTKLKGDENINPQQFYTQTLSCLEALNKIYPSPEKDVAYENYIFLTYNFYEAEDNWIDKEEMNLYIKHGYNKIDLELINSGIRRNVGKVTELLKAGANPMINTENQNKESELLELISADESIHFINCISYHKRYDTDGYSAFTQEDALEMFTDLYIAASSAKVYDTVNSFIK